MSQLVTHYDHDDWARPLGPWARVKTTIHDVESGSTRFLDAEGRDVDFDPSTDGTSYHIFDGDGRPITDIDYVPACVRRIAQLLGERGLTVVDTSWEHGATVWHLPARPPWSCTLRFLHGHRVDSADSVDLTISSPRGAAAARADAPLHTLICARHGVQPLRTDGPNDQSIGAYLRLSTRALTNVLLSTVLQRLRLTLQELEETFAA